MLKRNLLCAAILAVSASPALAGNYYVVGTVGSSQVGDGSQIEQLFRDAGLPGVSRTEDTTSVAYKLQLGYQINPNFAIEGGFIDLGKFNYTIKAKSGAFGATIDSDVSARGFGVSALGMLPLNESATGFLKLGAIHAKLEVDAKISDTTGAPRGSVSESSSGWSPVLGIGANFKITPTADLRVECERVFKVGHKEKTLESDVRLISLGLVFKF